MALPGSKLGTFRTVSEHLTNQVYFNSNYLQRMAEFEEMTGIHFKHIRLLARAFTHKTLGYTNLTRGNNQRMEFLGDAVLQLITSNYLYRYFPDHHEGHLSVSILFIFFY